MLISDLRKSDHRFVPDARLRANAAAPQIAAFNAQYAHVSGLGEHALKHSYAEFLARARALRGEARRRPTRQAQAEVAHAHDALDARAAAAPPRRKRAAAERAAAFAAAVAAFAACAATVAAASVAVAPDAQGAAARRGGVRR